ncbi:MAG: hypothetical protein H7Y88_01550 [Phycisphaerales bacterium]|nr:hypothetical protein [Phycisphaerales bacterium]
MNLDPAPRLNKLVFLAIDAGLVATALIIVFNAKDPYAPLPFVTAVACVLIAAIIGLGPLVIEFIAENRDYVQDERRRVTDQVQRLQAAIEGLGRAAAQIKAVEESVHKTAHTAENLPYRMQEKLAEFNEALATKETDEREALERELDELRATNSDNLKAVADKIAKAAADWSGLESASRKQLASVQDATARLNGDLQAALAQIDARIAALQKAAASVPTTVTIAAPAPVAAVSDRRSESEAQPDGGHRPPLQSASSSAETAESKPAATDEPKTDAPPAAATPARPEPVEGVIESVTLSETSAPFAGEPKPKKPRAPRKPKPEDTLAAMSAESTPTENGTGAATEPASAATPEESSEQSAEGLAKAETSVSSDGATRLLVTAYIGIGNKLFIRGDGPGLSWDKGVPMQFVSIGKWGWASNDVTMPLACKLYKNDETAALSGEIFLEPGRHIELTALF